MADDARQTGGRSKAGGLGGAGFGTLWVAFDTAGGKRSQDQAGDKATKRDHASVSFQRAVWTRT